MQQLNIFEMKELVNEAYNCMMRLNIEYITSLNDETIQRIQKKLEIRHARRYKRFCDLII